MAKTEVQLQGLDGLLDALKALPAEIGAKGGGPARVALAKATRIIRDQAIANAPRDTGLLQENIIMHRDRKPHLAGAAEHYSVGVRRKSRRYANTKRNKGKGRVGKTYFVEGSAYYWQFIEFGFTRNGVTYPPRPFLRPAFESRKEEAMDTIVTELRAGLDRAARKLARKR